MKSSNKLYQEIQEVVNKKIDLKDKYKDLKKLVEPIVRNILKNFDDFIEDLEQELHIRLYVCLTRYDKSKNNLFVTYFLNNLYLHLRDIYINLKYKGIASRYLVDKYSINYDFDNDLDNLDIVDKISNYDILEREIDISKLIQEYPQYKELLKLMMEENISLSKACIILGFNYYKTKKELKSFFLSD